MVADGGDSAAAHFVKNDIVRVSSGGETSFHVLGGDADFVDARPITLNAPLTQVHPAGAAIAEREVLLNVQGFGRWCVG